MFYRLASLIARFEVFDTACQSGRNHPEQENKREHARAVIRNVRDRTKLMIGWISLFVFYRKRTTGLNAWIRKL